jgi:hypothetical protein
VVGVSCQFSVETATARRLFDPEKAANREPARTRRSWIVAQ